MFYYRWAGRSSPLPPVTSLTETKTAPEGAVFWAGLRLLLAEFREGNGLAGLDHGERLDLALLHREDRHLGVLAVALRVERDLAGDAVEFELRQLRQVLLRIGGVRLLHRRDQHVGRVVGERRVQDRVGVELLLVGVQELLVRGRDRDPGLRAEQAFRGFTGELGHLVGAGAVAKREHRLDAELAAL